MASAPRLPQDPKSSLAEKGEPPKKKFTTPVLTPRTPSPEEVSVTVRESDQKKGEEVLGRALFGVNRSGGKKSKKQKKRVQKKTQKRRGRK
jgi:hypothetical protein